MTAFFFYFKIIVVIEMKKKLINPLKIGKNLKRCVYQMKEGKMTLENQKIL